MKARILMLLLLTGCTGSVKTSQQKGHSGKESAYSKDILSIRSNQTGAAYSPENINDQNLTTYWIGKGDGNWVQLELAETKKVASVNVAFREGNKKVYKFDILFSTDGKKWQTKFSGQSSGTSVNYENFRFHDLTSGKFVRIVGHGNDLDDVNQYSEVQILTPNPGYPFSNSALNFKPRPKGVTRSHIVDHENFSLNNYPIGTNVTAQTLTPPFYTQAVTDYNMVYSNQKVKTGTRSARIELRPYDKNPTLKTTSGNISRDKTVIRSEILLAKDQEREVWYAVSMFLPQTTSIINGDTIPGYVLDSHYDIITQWHAWDDTHLGEKARNPPIALFIENGKLAFKKYWSVDQVNSNVKTNIPGKQGYQTFDLGPASEFTGKWLNWVYHFVYDYRPGGQGQIQVWLNGLNIIDDYGPNIFNDRKKYPYFKTGLYKRDFDKTTPKRVLYLDEIYHGDSLATYNDVRTDE